MMKFSVKKNPLNLQRGTIKHARVTYISVTPVKNWFVFEAISGDYYYIPFVAFDDHVLIFVIRWYAIKSRASTLHFQYIQPKNKRRFGTQIEKNMLEFVLFLVVGVLLYKMMKQSSGRDCTENLPPGWMGLPILGESLQFIYKKV